MSASLTLDREIAVWVFVPLLIFALIHLRIRNDATQLLQPAEAPVDVTGLKQRSVLSRAARLRANGGLISYAGWKQRHDWLLNEQKGRLHDKSVTDPNPMQAMAGMGMMGDSMKLMIFTQFHFMGVMWLINYFFPGFIVAKLPFTLTERFRAMTQQGLQVPQLDTSYVSTGSWYFFAQMGLAPLLMLFSKLSPAELQRINAMQASRFGAGAAASPTGFMAKTLYNNEAKALGIAQWEPLMGLQSERELLDEADALRYEPATSATAKKKE